MQRQNQYDKDPDKLQVPNRDALTVYALRRLAAHGQSMAVLERVSGGAAEWLRLSRQYHIERGPPRPAADAATIEVPSLSADELPTRTATRKRSREQLDAIRDIVCDVFGVTAFAIATKGGSWRAAAAFLILGYEHIRSAETKAIARTIERHHATIFSHLRKHRARMLEDAPYCAGFHAAEARVLRMLGR